MLTPRTPFLARATQTLRATSSLRTPLHRRFLSSTRPLSQAAAREEHSAHTVTHRVRFWVKSLPIETYPLFVVLSFALSFGVYSFIRPALQDPTLRLKRKVAAAAASSAATGAGGHH